MCAILYLEVCTLIITTVRNKIEMGLTYVDSYQLIIVRSYLPNTLTQGPSIHVHIH